MISQKQSAKSRMHICHIIFRLDFGGLENETASLAQADDLFHAPVVDLGGHRRDI